MSQALSLWTVSDQVRPPASTFPLDESIFETDARDRCAALKQSLVRGSRVALCLFAHVQGVGL